MTTTVTLSELRSQVKEIADLENSEFVSPTRLNVHINMSMRNLYRKIVATYEDYYVTPHIFTLSSTQSMYDLPNRFYKFRKLEADTDGNAPWLVPPYVFLLEHAQSFSTGNLPSAQMTLWYIPAFRELTETAKTFVDADVNTTTDTITETAHSMVTGESFTLTTTGVLPSGLALLTTYYAIVTGPNTFQVASSYENALDNTEISITAAAGGGTHTIVGDFDTFDSINGWHDYAVFDVVIKVTNKGEREESVWARERQRALQDLMQDASLRNPGQQKKVWDVNMVRTRDRVLLTSGGLRYQLIGNKIRMINTAIEGA